MRLNTEIHTVSARPRISVTTKATFTFPGCVCELRMIRSLKKACCGDHINWCQIQKLVDLPSAFLLPLRSPHDDGNEVLWRIPIIQHPYFSILYLGHFGTRIQTPPHFLLTGNALSLWVPTFVTKSGCVVPSRLWRHIFHFCDWRVRAQDWKHKHWHYSMPCLPHLSFKGSLSIYLLSLKLMSSSVVLPSGFSSSPMAS